MTTMEMEPGLKPLLLSMPGHYHIELRVARRDRATQVLDAPGFIDIP